MDESPNVRLEAVACATRIGGISMVERILTCRTHPTDRWLDYAIAEALIYFRPIWLEALAGEWAFADEYPASIEVLLEDLSPQGLLALKRRPAVCQRLLQAPGIPSEVRMEALTLLGQASDRSACAEWVRALTEADSQEQDEASGLGDMLTSFTNHQVTQHDEVLLELAWNGKHPSVRVAALAAAIYGQDSISSRLNEVLKAALQDPERLELFLQAQALLGKLDPDALATGYGRLQRIDQLVARPTEWPGYPGDAQSVPSARYLSIELPSKNPLTLAEVEVWVAGENVAPLGQATQSSDAWGGVASHAIDGNRAAGFASGSQTHTSEGSEGAWWRLDLGHSLPVKSIQIWNRQEGGLGKRLEGFHLRLLDEGERVVWQSLDNAAPDRSVEFILQNDWQARIQRAGLRALVQCQFPAKEALAVLPTQMTSVPIELRGAQWYQDGLALLMAAGQDEAIRQLQMLVFQAEFTADGKLIAGQELRVQAGSHLELHIQNNSSRQANLALLATDGSVTPDAPLDPQGTRLYAMYCGACHKPDGAGLLGPNMTDDHYKNVETFADIEPLIRKGVPGTSMVALESTLTDDQISILADFSASLRGTHPKDPLPAQGKPIPPFANPASAVTGLLNMGPVIDPGSTGLLRLQAPMKPGEYPLQSSLPGLKHLGLRLIVE